MTYLGTYGDDFSAPSTSAEINLQAVLNYTQSIEGNYSDISWVFQMVEYVNASPFRNYNDCPANLVIESTVYSAPNLNYNFDLTNETIVVATGTKRIYHNADGTKTGVTISGSYDAKGALGSAAFSTTFDLPAIPRASVPTYDDSTPDAGATIAITTNRADAGFTHDLEYRWQGSGSAYTSIEAGVGASTTWVVPAGLIADIPNSVSRVLEIRTTTKSGATSIGTSLTTITVGVPAAVVPDFDTVTHAEATTTPDVDVLIGGYVQGFTKLALAITSAVAGSGATIASKVVQVRSGATVLQTVDVTAGAANTPSAIVASGTVTLRGIVTDSRGRTHSEDVAVTVLAYALPDVNAIGLARSLSDGTVDEDGTYIRVDIDAAVQSLDVAGEQNALTYRISTSPRDADTWTVKSTTTPGGVTFVSHAEVGTYPVDEGFDVRVEVYDKLTSSVPYVAEGTISTAGVFMHLGNRGEGVGIGKYWEQRDVAKPAGVDVRNWIYQNDGERVLGVGDIGTPADAIAGTSEDLLLTPAAMAAAYSAFAQSNLRANRMRNSDWRVNQDGYVSGAALPPQQYGPDWWCASGLVNMLTNPSAETNTTGMTGGNCTLTRVNTWAAPGGGSWSFQMALTGADSYIQLPTITFTPGRTYTIVGTGRLTAALTGAVTAGRERRIWVLDSLSNVYTSSQIANAAGEARVAVTFTVPLAATGTTIVRLYAAHAAGTMWWDNIMVLEGDWSTNLPDYFDGSIAGCMWTGTAHASMSYNVSAVGSITLPADPQGGMATLSSGMKVFQPLERENLAAGPWTVHHPGDAEIRVYNATTAVGSRPAFAASPVVFVADGLDDVIVEAYANGGTATLGQINFIPGSTEQPYVPRTLSEELALCGLQQVDRYARKAGTNDYLGTSLADVSGLSITFSTPVQTECVALLHYVSTDGNSGGGRLWYPEFMLDGVAVATVAMLVPVINSINAGATGEVKTGTVQYPLIVPAGSHTLKVRARASAAPAVSLCGSMLVLTSVAAEVRVFAA